MYFFLTLLSTGDAQAQSRASVGFEYGIIGEASNSAHQPERGVLLSTLGITQVEISQVTDNGLFGGTQGNDFDVDVTVLFTNGTATTFSASVNWRDTSGSTVRGIGLIQPLGAGADGTGYTPRSGYYTSYLLRFIGQSNTYSETAADVNIGGVSGNAANTGLLQALNAYLTASPASTTPSVLATTLTASATSIAANGTATSTITVQLKDVNGNNITTGGQTITLATSAGTLSAVTDNGNGTYTATLTSSNTVETATITGKLNTTDITDDASVAFTDALAPTITGPDGSGGSTTGAAAQETAQENTTTVATFAASEPVTWSLSGIDADRFSIDPSGNLRFNTAPDFENPSDSDTNNVYLFNIIATDTAGNTTTQTMTVTVSNVSEGQIGGTVLNKQGSAVAGVTIRLSSGGAVIASTTTNASGAYSFLTLGAGTYEVEFVPGSGGNGVKAKSDRGNQNGRFLENITLTFDQSITDADAILIDPAGVVYDSITRSPVAGTVVTFNFNGALVPNTWLDQTAGGPNTQTTGTDGQYSFVLNGTAQSGVYTLDVATPTGFTFQSVAIPVTAGPYNPGLGGGIVAVQPQATAPTGSDATTYYLDFSFTIGTTASTTSNGVINNHIPIDPDADVTTSTITASPISVLADGIALSTVTVQAKDSSGNDLPYGGEAVVLSSDLGTLSAVTDNGDGTYEGTITSTTAGIASITGTIDSAAITDDAEVTFTTADTSAPSFTFNPANLATGVAVNSDITITASEAIRLLDNTALDDTNIDALITLKDTDAGGADIPFDATIVGNVITINPTNDFSSLQQVYVAIDGTAIEDTADNASAAANATFTTADTSAPPQTNTAPVASAGPDQTVASSVTVTLDGSASSDGDGDTLTYAWSQASGTAVTLSSTTVAQPTFTAPTLAVGDANAVLVFSLTVNDGTITSLADTVTITVEAPSPTPATAFAEYEEEIRATLVDDARRNLTSAMSANQRLIRNARDHMIETQRLSSQCRLDETFDDALFGTERDQSECAPNLVSTRNNVPFDVDGNFELNGATLSTQGRFFEQTGNYDGTQRRLFFGDFYIQRDGDTGSTTATLTGRVAWEQMTSDVTMLGYFIGGEFAKSNISGAFEGDQDRVGLTAGGYAVHQLADQVYLDGFLSYGIGRNNFEMANDVLALTNDYTTRTATAGAALSGVYEYNQYEFRPELSFSYGHTWIGNVGFTGRAYGLVDDTLSLDAGNVSIANLTLRPEVIWALDADTVADSNSQLSFAPRAICQHTMSITRTENCGGGAEIGLSSTSEDGLSNAEFRVIVDRVGSSSRSSFALNIEHRF